MIKKQSLKERKHEEEKNRINITEKCFKNVDYKKTKIKMSKK